MIMSGESEWEMVISRNHTECAPIELQKIDYNNAKHAKISRKNIRKNMHRYALYLYD